MQFERMRELAGLERIDEIVKKEDLTDLDDVIDRLRACKRALVMANKLEDPADRKKYRGIALANMNRVKQAVINLILATEKAE